MATNWQPPYGQPFAFPPPQLGSQQHQQPLHHDDQNGASDAFQAPPANLNTFVPPAWSIPGLNLQAYNQNAQQAQYHSAWPASLPTPEQLAQWQHQMHMDAQQFPFIMPPNPPQIPGLNFAPNLPPESPFQSATPAHPFPTPSTTSFFAPPNPAAQHSQNPMVVQNEHTVEVAGSDKEEGELSEGDRVSRSPATNGRFPDPPRSIPLNIPPGSNNSAVRQQDAYNPDEPAAGQTGQTATQSKTTVVGKDFNDALSQKRADARAFIKILHTNNIGYHTLAAEGLDAGSLRDLYRSLNLPSEPEPVTAPPKANKKEQPDLRNGGDSTARSAAAPALNDPKPAAIVNTNVPPTKSVPSPVNRQEYLKRLQATKKGKPNTATKATPPKNTPPPPVPVAPKAASTAPASGTADKQKLTNAEKRAQATEIIRRRIEALRNPSSSPAAAAASKPPVSSAAHIAPSSSPSKGDQMSPTALNASTPKTVPPSPFGNIPGLFMKSSPVIQHTQAPTTPVSNDRKRPLPSDLDNPPQRDVDGHAQAGSGPAPIAKAVSDNTAADAMEVDHVMSSTTPSVSTRNGIQNVPSAPANAGLPSRPASVNPSVSGMSTPGPQTPSSAARTQELEAKERKIAAFRERVQKKMEQEKRQNEQLAANASSPLPNPNKTGSSQFASQQLENIQTPPVSLHQVSPEPKRRRKEIEAKLPVLDAEIAENAARLAQLTKEMELLTANDTKMRRDKARLQAELESLGIDTEGMSHAELHAKRDEVERDQEAALATLKESSIGDTSSFPVAKHSATIHEPAAEPTVPGHASATEPFARPSMPPDAVSQPGIPGLNASLPLPTTFSSTVKASNAIHQDTPTQETVDQSKKPEPAKESRNAVGADEKLNGPNKQATPVDDEEDFYSPEPDVIPPVADQPGLASTSVACAKSPSEEGEMPMSESEEGDYEPAEPDEPQAYDQPSKANVAEQNATVTSSPASSLTPSSASSTHDDDAYEPPDVDQPMLDVQPNLTVTESQPIAQQGEAGEEEMDMSTSDDESGSDTTSDSSEEGSNNLAAASSSNRPDPSASVADDLAPELQPEASAVISGAQDIPAAGEENAVNPRPFVPYESPLRHFKSYRYHPNFPQDVSGGYLSMTWSHQIDPEKPLCATEASGASCNDPNCPDQHFQDMGITGEKLLVQLGTANPGKTQEERQRWNDGLRSVLKDLRQKNTKDPNGIAMEIANYRRQFLQDDTRVINL